MTKEFVPYNEALELKELGFDESCFAVIHKGGCLKTEIKYRILVKNSECK